MGVFRDLCEENWPRYIQSALYNYKQSLLTCEKRRFYDNKLVFLPFEEIYFLVSQAALFRGGLDPVLSQRYLLNNMLHSLQQYTNEFSIVMYTTVKETAVVTVATDYDTGWIKRGEERLYN